MWRLVDDKVESKTDSGRCTYDITEIQALLRDIFRHHFVASNDPQYLKVCIEEGLSDVDAVINEDGTFSLYHSRLLQRMDIDMFLYTRQKDVKNYLYDTDIRIRKALRNAAVDPELVFQKLYQTEGARGLVLQSEIRWFVEESEITITHGLNDLHKRVAIRNPKATGDRLISDMFLENMSLHLPTVEELRALYFDLYKVPFRVTGNAKTESKELVEQIQPRLAEVDFVISYDGKMITMRSSRYPQICLQHIKNYVKKSSLEPTAPS